MTILEATVEITKAAISGNNSSSQSLLLTDKDDRKQLLSGIEDVYNKLKELESKKEKN